MAKLMNQARAVFIVFALAFTFVVVSAAPAAAAVSCADLEDRIERVSDRNDRLTTRVEVLSARVQVLSDRLEATTPGTQTWDRRFAAFLEMQGKRTDAIWQQTFAYERMVDLQEIYERRCGV